MSIDEVGDIDKSASSLEMKVMSKTSDGNWVKKKAKQFPETYSQNQIKATINTKAKSNSRFRDGLDFLRTFNSEEKSANNSQESLKQ